MLIGICIGFVLGVGMMVLAILVGSHFPVGSYSRAMDGVDLSDADGVLEYPHRLSGKAKARLKESWIKRHTESEKKDLRFENRIQETE